jgi:hypothetical protein
MVSTNIFSVCPKSVRRRGTRRRGDGHALPTVHSRLPPCTPRSGDMRRSRLNCRPHPLPRLRGTKGGCGGVEGNRQGSPAGRRRGSAPQIGETADIGEVYPGRDQCMHKNRQGSPAGRRRGSAPQIGETADIGEVSSYRMPVVIAATAWACVMVAGLRAPHPRAGPAPPPRTGRGAPVTPACGASISSRAAAHAVRRSARAGADGRPFGRCDAPPNSHALSTIRACSLPCNPRSGGMRSSRTTCRPHPLPRKRGTKGGCGGVDRGGVERRRRPYAANLLTC